MATITASPAGASVAVFERAYAEQRAHKRRVTLIGVALFAACFLASAIVGNFDPVTIWNGLPRLHEFVVKMIPPLRWETLGADLREWFHLLPLWLGLLWETMLIAFLATAIGIAGAFILCFPASRNLAPNLYVYHVTRRALEIARTVPELVYALIFVFAFGVGPLAGVLAIAVHATGALGKLFSEVNENVDTGPIEGLRGAGADWPQMIRFAVVPQVLPNFVSYSLLRFEINVRSSSIIGFVGAGGLGQEIATALNFQEYYSLSAIFIIILITVATIDITCEHVRHRYIGKEGLA